MCEGVPQGQTDRDDLLGIWLGFASTDEGGPPFVEVDVVGRDVLVHVASNLTLAHEWRLTRRQ